MNIFNALKISSAEQQVSKALQNEAAEITDLYVNYARKMVSAGMDVAAAVETALNAHKLERKDSQAPARETASLTDNAA